MHNPGVAVGINPKLGYPSETPRVNVASNGYEGDVFLRMNATACMAVKSSVGR